MNKPIALSVIACLAALTGTSANDLSRSDKSLPVSPSLVFEDVAAEAGLDFQHYSGSPEKRYILESMSGGVAWIDFDRDGWMDLYLVNGGRWEELVQGKRTVSNALYRNNGDGTFTDVTEEA
ncbi:MAG: VCBS repeat-containing protein [Acidobacteria bacterium]|nr:VCBS repeat-containing protein [Acidobacteriota bacterium]